MFTEALATARDIPDAPRSSVSRRASALAGVAEEQAKAKMFAEALATTKAIEDARNRAQALSSIAREKADPQLFIEALATARGIEEETDRARALSFIAGQLPAPRAPPSHAR